MRRPLSQIVRRPRLLTLRFAVFAVITIVGFAGLPLLVSGTSARAASTEPAIHFVVDVSGSMAGAKLESAVAAIQQTAAAIPDTTALGLRSYSGGCDQSTVPPVVPISTGDDAQIVAAAAGLVAGGGTPTTEALGRGIDELVAYPSTGPKRLVLMTDGDTQCGISICDYVKQHAPTGVSLQMYAVGLQVSDAAAADLTCAAQATGGSYIAAQDPSDLANALAQATGALPAAGQVVCARGAGGSSPDGWSYTARMTASEGLVIENAHYGPRLAARLLSVPYLKIVGQDAIPGLQNRPTTGHLTVTPDPADTGLQSKLVRIDCAPSGGAVKALYSVFSLATNRVFAVEQSYRFDAFDADGHYCEATESAKCAKFWPTVSWALVDGPPPVPGFGLNIVQRFEFDPDAVDTSGASDVISDDFRVRNLGVDDLAADGRLRFEDQIAEGANDGPAIKDGKAVRWDNWHQTGRDHVGLPSPLSPGCSECVHAHWSWFGSLTGAKLDGANQVSCAGNRCWTDGKPMILDGSKQTAVIGWAVAQSGERQPADWRSLIGSKKQGSAKVDSRRLVVFWDAQTPASGAPTAGVPVGGVTYAVGDSYWPQLDNYRHGGTGGIFVDPARAFRTVATKPGAAEAVITPDFARAAQFFAAPAGSRLPSGYLLPVRIKLETGKEANNQGPYYLRIKSANAALLNPDRLYTPSDGGAPWIRIYDDKAGDPVISAGRPMLLTYPAKDDVMLAFAVFDRPPAASDVVLQLNGAPDGERGYVPASGTL